MLKVSVYRNLKDDTIMIVQDGAPSEGKYNVSEGFNITKFFVKGYSYSATWTKDYLLHHIETYSFQKMKLIKDGNSVTI